MHASTRHNYIFAIIIGLEIGFFLFILSRLLHLLPDDRFAALFILMPILSFFGIYGAMRAFNGKLRPFGAYGLVGLTNTLVDFTIFNLVLTYAPYPATGVFIIARFLAFSVALAHSFIWNASWTFGRDGNLGIHSAARFAMVTCIGLVLNVVISSAINMFSPLVSTIPAILWANISVAIATGASLISNFLGYNYLVFKKK